MHDVACNAWLKPSPPAEQVFSDCQIYWGQERNQKEDIEADRKREEVRDAAKCWFDDHLSLVILG